MKEILEQIHKILLSVCMKLPVYTKSLGDEVQKLGKLIDDFKEAELTDREKEAAEKYLRGITGRR